jgi:hypothetical protein
MGRRSGGGGACASADCATNILLLVPVLALAPVLVPFILDELDGMLYKSH